VSDEKPPWRNWGDHPIAVALSVIGALAGVAGAFFAWDQSRAARSAPAQSGWVAEADDSACEEVIGEWRQLQVGGVIRVAAGGELHWHSDDDAVQVGGSWACQEPASRTVLFRWDNGMQDTLVLSNDAATLTGMNQLRLPVVNSRVR
jgi:hypothetical protein